jgi:hypothetical protein
MTDMMDLMKADPKLKVVLKEFPVLSAGSVEAAQVGVAVRMQDPTGKKYLDFHQKLLTGRGAADKARAMAVAKEVGLDMAKLEKDLSSAEVRNTLEENFKLAEAMGMNGTPSYVIGKQVVIGAVGVEKPAGKDQQRPLRQGDVLNSADASTIETKGRRNSRPFYLRLSAGATVHLAFTKQSRRNRRCSGTSRNSFRCRSGNAETCEETF